MKTDNTFQMTKEEIASAISEIAIQIEDLENKKRESQKKYNDEINSKNNRLIYLAHEYKDFEPKHAQLMIGFPGMITPETDAAAAVPGEIIETPEAVPGEALPEITDDPEVKEKESFVKLDTTDAEAEIETDPHSLNWLKPKKSSKFKGKKKAGK